MGLRRVRHDLVTDFLTERGFKLGNVVQPSQTDTLHSTQWLSQAGGIPGDLYVFICCVLHNEHVLQRQSDKKSHSLWGENIFLLLKGIIRIKK